MYIPQTWFAYVNHGSNCTAICRGSGWPVFL